MERMIIKHISGSKANQVEEFSLRHHDELIFGRDVSSTVKYDPNRDDLVGRQHAKISRDPNDSNGFLITDLNSTNGTFVNKIKVSGTAKLEPGNFVQFGSDGPECQFDVEPRLSYTTKPTRISDLSASASYARATRVADMSNAASVTGDKPPRSVGKVTVERMINETVSETKKREGRRFAIIGGSAAAAVLLLFSTILGLTQYQSWSREQALKEELANQTGEINGIKRDAPVSPAEISDKYGKSVVNIDVAWRLIDTQNQTQLYHQYATNDWQTFAEEFGMETKNEGPIVPNGPKKIPVYFQVGKSGTDYEPLLTNTQTSLSVGIGSRHSGTGFIVSSDGFILTNRHVAAPWASRYIFPENTPRGIIIKDNLEYKIDALPPDNWVPANTQQYGRQYRGAFKGTTDTLEVTLPGKDSSMAAQLQRFSNRHDVAMIKVNVPGQLTKVDLNDNYDTLKKGEPVTIMGYPEASPAVYGIINSQDVFNPLPQDKEIPNPTVTTTNIGNIIRDSDDKDKDKRVSVMGDVYQLSTSSTGAGNSGGPVFDSSGRVIAIFFATSRSGGVGLTYAVPIRYGMEFLNS